MAARLLAPLGLALAAVSIHVKQEGGVHDDAIYEELHEEDFGRGEKSDDGAVTQFSKDMACLNATVPQIQNKMIKFCTDLNATVPSCRIRNRVYPEWFHQNGPCGNRLMIFDRLSAKISGGDPHVLVLLRDTRNVLKHFIDVADNLHDTLSALTKTELAQQLPKGVREIADIFPDDYVSREEYEAYLKAFYSFVQFDCSHELIGTFRDKQLKILPDYIRLGEPDICERRKPCGANRHKPCPDGTPANVQMPSRATGKTHAHKKKH